ncbi:MAG: nitrate reductase cytochrome c-type subunit [Betaproteobacteria bacterium]|nr:nitrate reductase cytochrome c-type subunit [Betaproteobacteria bacterium]
MRKRFLALIPAAVLATTLLVGISKATEDGGLVTLRGAPVSAQEKAPTGDGLKKVRDTNPTDLNFTDQPPLVSHAVDKYTITINANKCMDCHSLENYRKEKTTRVPTSHFVSADGKTLPNLSPRRYFCVQCHVPQVDAKPLVANTFQRAQ